MLSTTVKILFVAVLTFNALQTTKASNQHVLNEVVRFVGSLDGKAFFAISNLSNTNWHEAGDLCRSKGMNLAELITLEHADMITTSYEAGYIPCCNYWTAGRDAFEPRQFSWNYSKSNVNESGVIIVGTDGNRYISCLTYEVDTKKLEIMQCLLWTQMILCELQMRHI